LRKYHNNWLSHPRHVAIVHSSKELP
jgi:hypothetical protein